MRFQYSPLVTLISRCFCPFLHRSESVSRSPHKAFPHTTQAGPKVVLNFSSISCLVSHAPLYTRRARVSIYVSFIVFSFPSSLQHSFFPSLVASHLPPFNLSVPLCSVPPRFLPVEHTTVSLSSFPLPANASPSSFHFWPFPSRYVHIDPGTELYYLFISTAERDEENNGDTHQG